MGQLRESGKALFFPVGNGGELCLDAPDDGQGVAIRTHVRSLSGMQKEALVVSQASGTIWRLASDEGAYLNGDDEAPCPLSFVTTGMVSSYMDQILKLAHERHIELGRLRLLLDNFYTMKGSVLKGTMTGGAQDIELEVQIESPAGREELTQLLHDAISASPVSGLTRNALQSRFALRHNGRPLESIGVGSIDAPFLSPAQDASFDAARSAAGDRDELIRRNGLTPKTQETTGFAGSSLAEHQNRILHIRGICTQRDDGVKQIEQQLFNPHGSIFHYLCDEAPDSGGSGRAPDALSYVSAGIGFCFMTQLGRYAKIARKDLRDCRIVQDTRFSPGRADPVATWVDLTSGESDGFAQTALAMSEQTCFLHALCRTELRTRIRLSAI